MGQYRGPWHGADQGRTQGRARHRVNQDSGKGARHGADMAQIRLCPRKAAGQQHRRQGQTQAHLSVGRLAGRDPAKVGRRRVLPRLDNTPPNGTGAGEIVKQLVAIAHADGALQHKQLFGKTA